MPKDYAKYNAKRRASKKKNRYLELFAILFLLLVIGIGSYWVYVHKLRDGLAQSSQFSHAWANLQSFLHRSKKPVELSAIEQAKAVAAAQAEVQFNFYDELPHMQVTATRVDDATVIARAPVTRSDTPVQPPITDLASAPHVLPALSPVAAASAAAPASPVKKAQSSSYFLKIGNFKDKNEAGEMRISLLLMGIDVELDQLGDSYYLRLGIFPNNVKAKEAQKRLQQKGIESTIEQIAL